MARGKFDRNEIQDRNSEWLYIEKEEKIEKGGNIFLATKQYGFNHGSYSIYWRKTRNVVRYDGSIWSCNMNMDCIKDRIETKEEGEKEYALAVATYNPGTNATKRMKRSGPSDSQRKRVYAWERGLFNAPSNLEKHPLNEKMTPKQLKKLFKRILDHYDIPENERPLLKFRSCYGKSNFNYGHYGKRDFIRLSKSHLKTWVVIHELSHFLTYRASGSEYSKIAGHGPEFVGWYIDALVKVEGQDLGTLLRSCRDYEYKTRKRTMRGVKYTLPTTNEMNSLKEAA